MATVQLLHQQANIIPRFLIDDVYFTGILLHGFSDVKMYTYEPLLEYTVYVLTNVYNLFKNDKYRINLIIEDFYKKYFFLVINTHLDLSQEINYEFQKYNNTLRESMCNNINFLIQNTTRFIEQISLCFTNELYGHLFYKICSRLWTRNNNNHSSIVSF